MKSESHHLNSARLDKVCRLVTDGTHDSPRLQLTGVPFIKGKHISGGFVDFENCDFITEDEHRKAILRSKPERGDILFSNIGSVGDAAYVGTSREFSIKNVALFKPDYSKVTSRYLYYVVIGPEFRGELMSKRQGVAQPFFSLEMLRSHQVRYYEDIATQRKIAAILSAYDDLIENNLRRIKILEDMAQNLYREWFVKFRFPGHQHTRFTASPLGRIPEGWAVVKVGDILKKVKRGTKIQKQDYTAEGSIPVVDQGKEFIGGFTDNTESLISYDLPMIVFGDHTRVLKFIDFPFACGADGTQLLKSNDKRMPMTLFYYALLSIDLSDFAYARHFKFLKEEVLILPAKSIADHFDQFVSPLRDQVRSLMQKNTTLRRTRDLLLPRLISGEVDVTEVDITVSEEAQA